DDLRRVPDRAPVTLRILLVGLLVRREPQPRGEVADLAEPLDVRRRRLVPRSEVLRHRTNYPRVQPAEPGIGRIGHRLEDLREEVPVHGAEFGPPAQVLAR